MPKYCVFNVANLIKTMCKSGLFFNNHIFNKNSCAKNITKIHTNIVFYSNKIHSLFYVLLSVKYNFYTLSTMPTITITNNIKG